MRKKLTAALIVVALSTACGRSDLRRDQKQYETVEEGSASGVTSTIQGPGETLPPVTDTNADGTSAFALDPNTGASVPTSTAAVAEHALNPTPALEPSPTQTQTTATQPTEPTPPAENTDPATTTQPPEKEDAAETTSTEEPPPPPHG